MVSKLRELLSAANASRSKAMPWLNNSTALRRAGMGARYSITFCSMTRLCSAWMRADGDMSNRPSALKSGICAVLRLCVGSASPLPPVRLATSLRSRRPTVCAISGRTSSRSVVSSSGELTPVRMTPM